MNYDSLKSPNIDDIKDEFSSDFIVGKKPTLTQYLDRYPQFADELTDFILTFAQLNAVPIEVEAPTPEAERAMQRALSASRTHARTIIERMAELGLTKDQLAQDLRAPMDLFALFHRNHVSPEPSRFVKAVANVLKLTEMQSRRMLAPQALSYRAKGTPQPAVKTFEQLVDELYANKLISQEDRAYWLAQGDGE